MNYPVVTLCGSSKLKEEFEKVSLELTLKGVVTISLSTFSKHDSIDLTDSEIEILREIHKQKIDMSDSILVITKNGHIGEGTKEEIEYAKSKNKNIMYYNFE